MRTPAAATWRAWTLRLALSGRSCSSARSMASPSRPAGTGGHGTARYWIESTIDPRGTSVTDFDPSELYRGAHIPDLLVAASTATPTSRPCTWATRC